MMPLNRFPKVRSGDIVDEDCKDDRSRYLTINQHNRFPTSNVHVASSDVSQEMYTNISAQEMSQRLQEEDQQDSTKIQVKVKNAQTLVKCKSPRFLLRLSLFIWGLCTWLGYMEFGEIKKVNNGEDLLSRNAFVGHPQRSNINGSTTELLSDSASLSWRAQAMAHKLATLRSRDYEKFTIRMNTWKRNEQLIVSLNHHSRCEGVAQIQVIWCDHEEEPPEEVVNHKSGKVVVEKHDVDSLNERFHVLIHPPTLGILNLDDDLLRPCEALDAGFFLWTKAPDRMIGYDYRSHIEEVAVWKYGSLSDTQATNLYSMVLTRAAFTHRDYLTLYYKYLPRSIYNDVETNFNCEDIAMTLFVSSLTSGQPPLLADWWAIQSLIKLYSPDRISGTTGHKENRGTCVESYSRALGLRGDDMPLQMAEVRSTSKDIFNRLPEHNMAQVTEREKILSGITSTWRRDNFRKKMRYMMDYTCEEAYNLGLIEKTMPWEERWKNAKK